MEKLKISEEPGSYRNLLIEGEGTDPSITKIVIAGIGTRLGELVKQIGTRKEVSNLIGTSPASLHRYISGINMPPFDVAAHLCLKTGVRMEWLATGHEPKKSSGQPITPLPVVMNQLRQALAAVEQGLQEADRIMSPEKKAELVMAVYELFTGAEGDSANEAVLRLVRAAL